MKHEHEAYHVVKDKLGCEHCGAGRLWMIVGPDDFALGQVFTDQEDADDLARLLNAAHQFGAGLLADDTKIRRYRHNRETDNVEPHPAGDMVRYGDHVRALNRARVQAPDAPLLVALATEEGPLTPAETVALAEDTDDD